MQHRATDATDSFGQRPAVRLVIIAFLLAGAFAVRLYRINQPLLDFHPIRQYRSAILARAYYYGGAESIPKWKKEVSAHQKQRIPLLEPPVGELVAATVYRIVGGEYLWLPRIISCVYWLVGGGVLYLIATRLISAGAAIFSTLFYLFWPYNIFVSRSFQPEAMMVMLFLLSIFLILRYYDRPTIVRLTLAACVSGCAILIKPYIIFPIYAAFVSLGILKRGIRAFVLSLKSVLFVAASLLLTGAYYGHSFLASNYLAKRAGMQFIPHLLLTAQFWTGWLTMIGHSIGILALIAAVIGTFLCPKGPARGLLAGLWAGYLVFGLVFNYAIHTHDYYQLPLVPIVSIGLGPIGVALINSLRRLSVAWRRSLGGAGIVLLALVVFTALNIRPDQFFDMNPELKSKLEVVCNFIGVNPHLVKRINADFASQAKTAEQIGRLVNHNTKTFLLAGRYSRAFMYHGQLCSVLWSSSKVLQIGKLKGPQVVDPVTRFKNKYQRHSPEYFIVADLEDFEGQTDLRDFLANRFGVLAESDKYLIFDLRKNTDSAPVRD
jgi:hypothetical protein